MRECLIFPCVFSVFCSPVSLFVVLLLLCCPCDVCSYITKWKALTLFIHFHTSWCRPRITRSITKDRHKEERSKQQQQHYMKSQQHNELLLLPVASSTVRTVLYIPGMLLLYLLSFFAPQLNSPNTKHTQSKQRRRTYARIRSYSEYVVSYTDRVLVAGSSCRYLVQRT